MIHWNPDPIAFSLGSFVVRWYSLCWCLALIGGYIVVHRLYKRCKVDEEKFEPLFMYCFLGILIGARLGHCLFYEPGYYLSHPLQMLLPFDAEWHFTGYEGLASHGGTLGLMIAIWLYCRKTGVKLWWLLDVMGITAPLCAMWIRIGNLMNSEIIGNPTDVPWAFWFNGYNEPRHPSQLYEAGTYLIIFVVGLWLFRKFEVRSEKCELQPSHLNANTSTLGSRFWFGWCLTAIFAARILIEYTKKEQVEFEKDMLFNMGQLLSVPFVVGGIYCMYYAWQRRKTVR